MPAGDRTGPWGFGSRTGRSLGYCSGYRAPGFMCPGPGVGLGRGFGFGRGFGLRLGRGFGLGRGRSFRNPWFGGFWGYPYAPVAPLPYPYGIMPYSPYPPVYGRPYGPAYPGPRPSSAPGKKP